MAAGAGSKALTIVFVSVLSWYAGMKFWKPIVIENLRETGNLRDDIPIEYDENEQPASWADLKQRVKYTLHPDLEQQDKLKHIEQQDKLKQNSITQQDQIQNAFKNDKE